MGDANQYQRGVVAASKAPDADERKALRVLTEKELARMACDRMRVSLHMPEVAKNIEVLHKAGAIDGWRNVSNFKFEDDQ